MRTDLIPFEDDIIFAEHERDYGTPEPEEVCKVCGESEEKLYEGFCRECLSKAYDEHERDMFPFFCEFYPEDYFDYGFIAPLPELWADSERERNAYVWGPSREELKIFAMDDEWCLAEWMHRKEMI